MTDQQEREDRRSFLKVLTALAGSGAAALAGIPAFFSFISPTLRRKSAESWVKLGDAGIFETGVPRKVDVPETVKDAWVEARRLRSIWVYTEDSENFTVYDARCTHLGCSYTFNREKGAFQCPCHAGTFDPKTGAVLSGPPPRPLDRIAVKVEEGTLFAQMGSAV